MKRILNIMGILLFLVQPVMGQQIFVELDEDFPYWIDKTTTTNKSLVAFSPKSTIGYREASFRISTWNGLFWTQLPTISATNVFYGANNNLVVETHQNKIIVAGSFYTNDSLIRGVTQWNGSSWEALGGGLNTSRLIHDEFSIRDVVSFDDDLFVCGDFNLADGLPVMNFAKFSNGSWLDIPSGIGDVNHLQVLDSALYAAGSFTLIDGVLVNNLAQLKNGKWEAVPNSFSTEIKGLGVYGSNLVVVTSGGFYQYANNSWTLLGQALDVLEVEDIVSYGGRLYATGLFVRNNTDSIRLIALTETDMTVYLRDSEIVSSISNKIMLNELDETLYVSGSFSKLKGKEYQRMAAFRPGNSVLQGQVYMDKNSNCVYDAGDEPKANAIVSLNKGESYTSTDDEGRYTLFVSNNATSTIEIFPAYNEIPLCNGAERTVVTTGRDSLLIEDFALKLNQMTPVRLTYTGESGYIVKHGYSANYVLDCSTVDETTYPMQIQLHYDKRLSEFNASLKPTSTGNGFATWEVSENTTIGIEFLVSPYAIEMGEQLSFDATAKAINSNVQTHDKLNQTVVSAFDPNDKQCDKAEISTTEETLEYFVRFQNLGTDNARDIHVVDTIDKGIPIEFIQIHKNSHYERYTTSYKVRGHAIVWSFKDIELPPKSIAGDKESSGYVAYQCGMSEQLQLGDVFKNKAYIYFDFQPPVITNTTESVVIENGNPVEGQVEEFVVYPNPAIAEVNIQSKHIAIQGVSVYATDGKRVHQTQMMGSSLATTLDLQHLPNGIYFVQIDHALGTKVIPVVLSSVR